MKRIISLLLVALIGLAVGGGAGAAASMMLGPSSAAAADAKAAQEPEAAPKFVPVGPVVAPLVFADGRLSGYVQFELELGVAEDKTEWVTARLPLLLHAINLRTYRAPLASGPDGMLPNLETFRKVVVDAAGKSLGADVVKRVAIVRATPA